MALNTHKLNDWIRNHKGFALALPIAILLLIYFLSTSFNGLKGAIQDEGTTDGYNDSLPDRSSGMEIKDPTPTIRSRSRIHWTDPEKKMDLQT